MNTCIDSCLCVYHVAAILLALRTNHHDTSCPGDAGVKTSLAAVATVVVVDVAAVEDVVAADAVVASFLPQS